MGGRSEVTLRWLTDDHNKTVRLTQSGSGWRRRSQRQWLALFTSTRMTRKASNMVRVARAKSDLRLQAAAIARWDEEGGASQALEQQKIAKTHKHRALWITD